MIYVLRPFQKTLICPNRIIEGPGLGQGPRLLDYTVIYVRPKLRKNGFKIRLGIRKISVLFFYFIYLFIYLFIVCAVPTTSRFLTYSNWAPTKI
jgi:hypothetical protein